MTHRNEAAEDQALEALLAQARVAHEPVPDALMFRVLADADMVQRQLRTSRQAKPSFWAALRDAIGGWQGAGGLVAATCAGLWIGFNPPSALPDAGGLLLGYEISEDFSSTAELTSFGWDLEEG